MQIFVDESGTVGSGRCVIAAVLIDPPNKHVRRALKGLKRDPGGEIKGSVQTGRTRAKFIASLPRAAEACAVIVGDPDTPRLAAAFGLTERADIYAWTAAQVVRPLLRESVQGVTLDSSPYKRDIGRRVVATLEGCCSEAGFDLYGRIAYGDSRQHEGLQVADVLANTAYGEDEVLVRDVVDARSILRPLADAGRLEVTTVRTLYEEHLASLGPSSSL